MPRLEVLGRRYGPEVDWPRGTAFRGTTLAELHAALKDRQTALLTVQPGIPEDMCRHAIGRLEKEIQRRTPTL